MALTRTETELPDLTLDVADLRRTWISAWSSPSTTRRRASTPRCEEVLEVLAPAAARIRADPGERRQHRLHRGQGVWPGTTSTPGSRSSSSGGTSGRPRESAPDSTMPPDASSS